MAKQATKSKHAASAKSRASRRKTGGARRRSAGPRSGHARTRGKRWSGEVTEHSDALDLKRGVFKLDSPRRIAASLKRSAEHSDRRKSDPYRSAMSMLTFYINRGGKNLSAARKKKLEKAKDELRHLFARG
jgi:hypothetical protein